jgi:hypothetical protein
MQSPAKKGPDSRPGLIFLYRGFGRTPEGIPSDD